MRQWDIYLYRFTQERPHPVVILSNDELCDNAEIEYLNGLMCASVRLDRPPKRREAFLDEADGLDWKTAVRCDFVYGAQQSAVWRTTRPRERNAAGRTAAEDAVLFSLALGVIW